MEYRFPQTRSTDRTSLVNVAVDPPPPVIQRTAAVPGQPHQMRLLPNFGLSPECCPTESMMHREHPSPLVGEIWYLVVSLKYLSPLLGRELKEPNPVSKLDPIKVEI